MIDEITFIEDVCDSAGTRLSSRRSQTETDGSPSRNLIVVADNWILRYGIAIHITPTKKMRKK